MRIAATVAFAGLLLSGCSKPRGMCPDETRSPILPYPPKTEADHVMKVDDCLIEFAGQVARGPSSDDAIARAAIGYCGVYDYPAIDGVPNKQNIEREEREALAYIVRTRGLNCPPSRIRDILTAGFEKVKTVFD